MFGLQPQNYPLKANLHYNKINFLRKRVGVDIILINKNIIFWLFISFSAVGNLLTTSSTSLHHIHYQCLFNNRNSLGCVCVETERDGLHSQKSLQSPPQIHWCLLRLELHIQNSKREQTRDTKRILKISLVLF